MAIQEQRQPDTEPRAQASGEVEAEELFTVRIAKRLGSKETAGYRAEVLGSLTLSLTRKPVWFRWSSY